MKRFLNILYVTNGIGDESHSIKQALKLANDNNAKLSVFIVCPPFPDKLKEYQQTYKQSLIEKMENFLSKARDSLKISDRNISINISLECGKAPDVLIIREVLKGSHDLLIKNAETNNCTKGFKALDMELLRKCPCALYLSRVFKHAQASAHVAVAIDANDEEQENKNLSYNLLELSHALAKNYSGKLDIISCWHFVYEQYLRESVWVKTSKQELDTLLKEEKQNTLKNLEELMKDAKVSDNDHDLHLVKGQPEEEIPLFINEKKIDVLVMGTVARTGIKGFIMGNTAENILQKLDCSLLALKPAGFVSPVSL